MTTGVLAGKGIEIVLSKLAFCEIQASRNFGMKLCKKVRPQDGIYLSLIEGCHSPREGY